MHKKLIGEDDSYDSIIKGHITQKSALLGHSTGGGAIFLAQASSPQTTTLISLAPLGELYGPISGNSPIETAKNITTPTLILSGEQDCITPPNTNHKPLYDNLNGAKVIVSIIGGDHCGFSDSLNCPLGESLLCGIFFQETTMDSQKQIKFSSELILHWLEHYLKENPNSWLSFESLLKNDFIKYEADLD